MGLTIHWTLSTQRELSDAVVKELAARTKAFAQKIGCEKVLGPKRGGPDEIKLRKLPNGDTTGDFIPAESGWRMMMLPGAGSEPAEFGLCRYPGSPHWKLTGACKTQYAAQHGWEHFLMCHRRVISLLDLWRDFGVDVKVADEGKFWETRSVERLRKRLGTYARLGRSGTRPRGPLVADGIHPLMGASGASVFGARAHRTAAEAAALPENSTASFRLITPRNLNHSCFPIAG